MLAYAHVSERSAVGVDDVDKVGVVLAHDQGRVVDVKVRLGGVQNWN